jgi:UDP-sulfoquinovose synthase
MRILIIGGDGYLGWAQAMYLSNKGHDIFILDNLMRREFDLHHNFNSLVPILSLQKRVDIWKEKTGKQIRFKIGSTLDFDMLKNIFTEFKPEGIVHYGEQRTAPYSMIDRHHCLYTMRNNVEGTINVLYAIKDFCPSAHLVKLGTMGEYGCPNIDIEEGYIEITHKGRKDTMLYPKNPGSFYHLTKVHDSNNIYKCCNWWGIKATDLNQGVVYGFEIDEQMDERLYTRFDYDQVYGTALNRFCVQAAVNYPLTVHGKGGQTRGYLNIKDTMKCVELALMNPAKEGEFRVFNQFNERFSINELAEKVKKVGDSLGLNVSIDHIKNPRVEPEEHYYNAQNNLLKNIGWQPIDLDDNLIKSLIQIAQKHKNRIDKDLIKPTVDWRRTSNTLPD